MKIRYQLPALLVAAFFIRPLLADTVLKRHPFGELVEVEQPAPAAPAALAAPADAASAKDKDRKKEPPLDGKKLLRELLEKDGQPIRRRI